MTSDPGVTLGSVVTSYFFKVLHPILVNIRLQMFFRNYGHTMFLSQIML